MATSRTAARTFGGTNDLFTAILDYKVTIVTSGWAGENSICEPNTRKATADRLLKMCISLKVQSANTLTVILFSFMNKCSTILSMRIYLELVNLTRFCLKVAIFFQKTTNLMIDHGFVDLYDSKQMAISSWMSELSCNANLNLCSKMKWETQHKLLGTENCHVFCLMISIPLNKSKPKLGFTQLTKQCCFSYSN